MYNTFCFAQDIAFSYCIHQEHAFNEIEKAITAREGLAHSFHIISV